MKNQLRITRVIIPVLFTFFHLSLSAQINVVSTTGYVVDINVTPQTIIPSSPANCTWGYNYNVKLKYQVTFTGKNRPSSLYTLQGTLGCGSSSNFFDLPNEGGIGMATTVSNSWRAASDCKSVDLTSLNCNKVNIEISGPGINSQTVSYSLSYTALPVTLTNFTAAAEGKKVKIKWATASENNNDYFTIQRSVKQNEWTDLEKIKGAGNSSIAKEYESYDKFPIAGISYYRIKQTDLDGKFTFSSISAVNVEPGSENISVFPSPNTGNSIKINGIADYKKYSMILTDMNEKPFFSTNEISSPLILPSLKPGMYLISFVDKATNERSILRYMKL